MITAKRADKLISSNIEVYFNGDQEMGAPVLLRLIKRDRSYVEYMQAGSSHVGKIHRDHLTIWTGAI